MTDRDNHTPIFSSYEEAKHYAISHFIPVDRIFTKNNAWSIRIYKYDENESEKSRRKF